jgi:exosortase/archaeosortase family protein
MAGIDVEPGCTSLKQWVHWIVLMVLFPGPWKHKFWYIPLGVIVIHFVNLIRITGLVLVSIPWSDHIDFFHDYVFKTFFYLMIFLMWLIWVTKFLPQNSQNV